MNKGFSPRRVLASAEPGTDIFETMPTVRLAMLAALIWRHGELRYERLFGLRTVECRMIGAVQAHQPLSLKRACAELGIDKSLGSRMVVKLVEAGLIERRPDAEDQRSFYLLLTARGLALHGRILATASERNAQWMSTLSADDAAAFARIVEQQIDSARALLKAEEQRQGEARAAPPAAAVDAAEGREAAGAGPLLVDRDAMLELHRRLGELLVASGARLPSP